MRNLHLAYFDKALYIWFGLGHSKTNATANIQTISAFSFDGHQIGKHRFVKMRSFDCYREASLGIQLRFVSKLILKVVTRF